MNDSSSHYEDLQQRRTPTGVNLFPFTLVCIRSGYCTRNECVALN